MAIWLFYALNQVYFVMCINLHMARMVIWLFRILNKVILTYLPKKGKTLLGVLRMARVNCN